MLYITSFGSSFPYTTLFRSKWVQKLGSDGATACVEVGDDQVRAKNTEPDGPTPRGEGLLFRGYEFPSSLTS